MGAVRTRPRYVVHNDLVARVTDMYYSTVDRVLHKVSSCFYACRKLVSDVQDYPFLTHVTKDQSTLYMRIKRITATVIRGTPPPPKKKRSWLHNSRVLSSRGAGGGTNSNCATMIPCDKQCAVTVYNVLLCWTASMDSLFPAFREGMSVPSSRAKMSKIHLGHFRPPRMHMILSRNIGNYPNTSRNKAEYRKTWTTRRKHGILAMNVYGLSRKWRFETFQDQNNHSPHIFHFMHNPRNSLELCDRFGSPYTAGRKNTFTICNIGILQITSIHFARTFTERISRATGTEWSLYKTVSSSTKGPLIPGASSPILSTMNDSP